MEKAKETGADQELMRSMKVSKAVAAMAIPSVGNNGSVPWELLWR